MKNLFQAEIEEKLVGAELLSAFAGSDVILKILAATLDAFDVTEGQVVEVLGTLYDKHIEPIDIPYVPNKVVEPMVDAQLRSALIASGVNLFKKIKEATDE